MIQQAIITHYRTEEAKAYRKIHGDRGGCRYQDKYHRPSPYPWSNCISTVTKDNLLWQQYERKQRQSRWRLVFQPSLSKARNRRLHQ